MQSRGRQSSIRQRRSSTNPCLRSGPQPAQIARLETDITWNPNNQSPTLFIQRKTVLITNAFTFLVEQLLLYAFQLSAHRSLPLPLRFRSTESSELHIWSVLAFLRPKTKTFYMFALRRRLSKRRGKWQRYEQTSGKLFPERARGVYANQSVPSLWASWEFT